MPGSEVGKAVLKRASKASPLAAFINSCLYNQKTNEQSQLYFSHQWTAGNPDYLIRVFGEASHLPIPSSSFQRLLWTKSRA